MFSKHEATIGYKTYKTKEHPTRKISEAVGKLMKNELPHW